MSTVIRPDAQPETRQMTLLQAINAALHEEMERDERVITFGQGIRGRVYGATGGLLDKFGPDRVRDTPISEPAEVGIAVGAAMTGLRPVVDLTIATFIYLAMDQIISQAAKNRYMFGGQARIPLVIRCGMGYGRGMAAHHSDRPYPLLMNIPGLKIIVPSSPADMKGLLKCAIRDDDPVICFEDSSLGGKEAVPLGDHVIPLGVSQVKRNGSDATVVGVASGAVHAFRAAESLAAEGVDVEVIDVRSVKPLDVDTILGSVEKTHRLVVVDPANTMCSAASEISASVAERGFAALRAPILRVTCPDVHVPFSRVLEAELFPTPQKVAAAVRRVIAY